MATPIRRPTPLKGSTQPTATAGPKPVVWGDAQRQLLRHQSKEAARKASNVRSVLDLSRIGNLPQWKIAEGNHFMDIVPYLRGEQDPDVVSRIIKPDGTPFVPGDPSYILIYSVHFNVGPRREPMLCLADTFGFPCPECEYRLELERFPKSNWKEAWEDPHGNRMPPLKEFSPNRRNAYLVFDRDQESKGLQVLDCSFFYMEEKLQGLASSQRGTEYIAYADPMEGRHGGRHVLFTVAKKTFTGAGGGSVTAMEFKNHQFQIRETPVPEAILRQAMEIRLDAALIVPTYEEVHAAFHGADGYQPAGAEAPSEEEASGGTPVCQYGGTIGTDFQSYQECFDNCPGTPEHEFCKENQLKGTENQPPEEEDIPFKSPVQGQEEPLEPEVVSVPTNSKTPEVAAGNVRPRPGGPVTLRRGEK